MPRHRWLNLSNDAWDAATGVDANRAGGKPESVVRLLGGDAAAATKTHAAAVACLLAGAASLCKAVAVTFTAGADPAVIATSGAMLAAATALGHAYQGPPFRLSYKGLGEPLCFAAFGPLATGAFYLALASGVPGGSVWSGLPAAPSLAQPGVMGVAALVGLTTTAILFASHLHQEEGDRAAGKISPRRAVGGAKRGGGASVRTRGTSCPRARYGVEWDAPRDGMRGGVVGGAVGGDDGVVREGTSGDAGGALQDKVPRGALARRARGAARRGVLAGPVDAVAPRRGAGARAGHRCRVLEKCEKNTTHSDALCCEASVLRYKLLSARGRRADSASRLEIDVTNYCRAPPVCKCSRSLHVDRPKGGRGECGERLRGRFGGGREGSGPS